MNNLIVRIASRRQLWLVLVSIAVAFLLIVPKANGLAMVLAIGYLVSNFKNIQLTEKIPVAILLTLCSVLFCSLIANLLNVSIHFTQGILGVAILVLSAVPQSESSLPLLRTGAFTAGSLVGTFLILLSASASFAMEPNTWYVFAMSGDSANNILLQLEHQLMNGISSGVSSNSVPMSAAILQLSSIATPLLASASELVSRYAIIWLATTALTSLLVGLYVANQISTEKHLMRFLASAIGSLLPLFWYFTGYSFDYGFFNAQLVLIVCVSILIIFQSKSLLVAHKIAFVFLSSVLLLATWSPLILITIGLGAYFLRQRALGEILGSSVWQKVVLFLSILFFALYALLYSWPNLAENGAALAMPGASFPFDPKMYLSLTALLVFAAAYSWLGRQWQKFYSVLVLVAAGIAGSVILARGYDWNFSGYYPAKFLWFLSLVGIIEIAAACATAISRVPRRLGHAIFISASVAAIPLTFVQVMPLNGYQSAGVIGQILGQSRAVKNYESVTRISAPGDKRGNQFYWKTTDSDEGFINFWNLQLRSIPMEKFFDRRLIAYGIYERETNDDLCQAVADIDLANLQIVTSDEALQKSGLQCQNESYEIVKYE